MNFGYEIIRLWERPVQEFLSGGLATLPLAPLGCLPEGLSLVEGMRQVVNEVCERLKREAAGGQYLRLLSATWVLTGLRVDLEQARAIFRGIPDMHESSTYQAILEEGMQRVLLVQGRKKLGEPDESTRRALLAITDLDRLDRLSERLLEVSTWQELLQTP
jgi:hypothetical protein